MDFDMKAYTGFAEVYDELMDDTPYEAWCDFLTDVFQKYGVDDVSKMKTCVIDRVNGDCAESDTDVIIGNQEGKTAADGVADTLAEGLEEQTEQNLAQERNTVLDLGCGTGTLTELLARRGYDMIGVDSAEEMLRIAMEKRERSGLAILYLLQDMRELELYGTVGAVISVCDSLNYLLTEEDIVQTFARVNNYLYPQGIFIFDFNTVYKYAVVIGDSTIAENREDCSFIWENYYHEEQEINEYDLTVFVAGERCGAGKESAADGEGAREVDCAEEPQWFRRFQELHYQRGYRLGQMKAFLSQAGLEFLEAMDADTHGEVTAESERVYVVARKGTGTTANRAVAPD